MLQTFTLSYPDRPSLQGPKIQVLFTNLNQKRMAKNDSRKKIPFCGLEILYKRYLIYNSYCALRFIIEVVL